MLAGFGDGKLPHPRPPPLSHDLPVFPPSPLPALLITIRTSSTVRTSGRSSSNLAINPVTFATAKLTPARFFSVGTPGIGRGYADAPMVSESPDPIRTSFRGQVGSTITPSVPHNEPGKRSSCLRSRADTMIDPSPIASATTSSHKLRASVSVPARLRLMSLMPSEQHARTARAKCSDVVESPVENTLTM